MTLVEVMVVTAILGVVMGAVYSLMLPVQKSTYTQTQVVDMQDSLRLAFEQMSLDIRHAGLMVNDDPIVNLNQNPPRSEFTIQLAARPQTLGARLVSAGVAFQLDPSIMLARFTDGQMVKIYNVVDREVTFPAIAGQVVNLDITDVNSDDANVNNANRFADDTVTFNLTPAELDILRSEDKVYYLLPTTAGDPAVHTITYIFDPNDNTLPGGARPTLRRYDDWPSPGAAIPAALPNPLPPNWLLLGGEPTAGGARKTYAAQFDYDEETHQVSIDITGATQAYDPNKSDDSLANAKARRLQTTVALRNAIPTYD
jgi:prepilin-type N-terminal cleavage/methylation domain-containing protein